MNQELCISVTNVIMNFKDNEMADINWKEIIAYILRLIADGLDKQDAISKAASKFNISKNDITRNFK